MIKHYFQTIFNNFVPGFGKTLLLALVYAGNTLWIISHEIMLPSLKTFFLFYLGLYSACLMIISIASSLFAHFLLLCTQYFCGTGTLAQTRRAVLHTFVSLLPINLLMFFVHYTPQYRHTDELISLITVAGSVLYCISAFITLTRTIAKQHTITKLQAAVSVGLSTCMLLLIAAMFSWLKHINN